MTATDNDPRARLRAARSLLFVPTANDRLVASAARRRCDGFILDLEDAIAPDQKPAARRALGDDAARLRQTPALLGVRVNRPWVTMLRDLETVVPIDCDFVVVPKIEHPQQVLTVAEMLDQLETDAALPQRRLIVTQIESAAGINAAAAIARAPTDRHVAMLFGPEDLALDLGGRASGPALSALAQTLVTAARAGGLVPLGSPGSIAETDDLDAYRAQIALGKDMGFGGVAVIHPQQAEIVHQVFDPSDDDIAWARGVLEQNDVHGGRPFLFRGKMVDLPVVGRARAVLAAVRRR